MLLFAGNVLVHSVNNFVICFGDVYYPQIGKCVFYETSYPHFMLERYWNWTVNNFHLVPTKGRHNIRERNLYRLHLDAQKTLHIGYNLCEEKIHLSCFVVMNSYCLKQLLVFQKI